MTLVKQLAAKLAENGVTPLDLEDTLYELMQVGAPANETEVLAKADELDRLVEAGLEAQVAWLAEYHQTPENLQWALSGFLNLPVAA